MYGLLSLLRIPSCCRMSLGMIDWEAHSQALSRNNDNEIVTFLLQSNRRLHSVAPFEWFQGGSRGCNVALKCCDTFVGLAMAFDAVSLFPIIPKTHKLGFTQFVSR